MALDTRAPTGDILGERGDGLPFTVTVTNSTSGEPIDLTTYAAWCTLKRRLTDSDADSVWQGTIADGAIVVGGAGSNVLEITIPAEASADLTAPARLFYDVQIKGPGAEPQTVMRGSIQFELDVTRAIA